MKTVPALHTDRCILTTVKQNDIPMIQQILEDTETKRFLPELCHEFQTEENLRQLITSFDKYLIQNEGVLWGVRKDDNLIGFIAIMGIPTSSTLFYAIHPGFRNNGYMRESLVKVMDYIYMTCLCSFLCSEVYHNHLISQKLLEDMGFKKCKMDKEKIYYRIDNLNKH